MARLIPTIIVFFPALVGCDTPSGGVVPFDLASCPPGWSEYSNARGRALVGLQPGGTLGGTVGTPLSDVESRRHFHAVNTAVTSTGGEHNHIWADRREGGAIGGAQFQWSTFNGQGNEFVLFRWLTGVQPGNTDFYPLTTVVPSNLTALHTDNREGHSHDVNVQVPFADVLTPYVQLIFCRKD